MAGPAIFCSRANGSVRISRHATSLVTVSTLIASGQVAQVTYRLNCALDNGLTKPQTPEVLTHLAFDAGCVRTSSRPFRRPRTPLTSARDDHLVPGASWSAI